MPACKMVINWRLPPDWPKGKVPEGPEDFSVEVECGEPAAWTYHDEPEASVCEKCFLKMIFDDPDLARDYRYGSPNGPSPAEVLAAVQARLDQYEKDGLEDLLDTTPKFEASVVGTRITIRRV